MIFNKNIMFYGPEDDDDTSCQGDDHDLFGIED